MKQFLKFVFASCLGSILAIGGIIFILFAISSSGSTPVTIGDKSILHLKIDHSVPELTDNVSPGQFGVSQGLSIGMNDITRLIRNAMTDNAIEGIFLQTESTMLNPTSALSLSKELEAFKKSGKFLLAYGDYFTQSGYILASVADSIYLNPNGLVDLRGYGTLTPYFEDFGEKFGIDFDVYHAGKYKSAVEPYYRSDRSDENEYQTRRYLDNYHDALVDHVAEARAIKSSLTNRIVSKGLSNNSEDAIKHGLVDALEYSEDVTEKLKERFDYSELVDLKTYYNARPKNKATHKNKIAIIYAEGDVAFGGKERGAISMETYNKVFDRLEKNEKIKVVVLRVNSPGGSSFTSDEFLKRVNDLRDAGKYVIASFGNYAASGGYYIAAGADKIISEPTTLTGSIGVFSMIPDFSDISENKLGINWDSIGTGERTFLYSTFISRSQSDNALLMAETERIYRQFKDVVSRGRDMELEKVEEVAQGRVWSGIDAVATGLVDTLGTLQDAIQIAANQMGYEDFKLIEYPIIKKEFWEIMVENIASQASISSNQTETVTSKAVDQLKNSLEVIEKACQSPQARMPFSIQIY